MAITLQNRLDRFSIDVGGFGPELIYNGDFALDSTGWGYNLAYVTFTGDGCNLNTALTYSTAINTASDIAISYGVTYRVSVDITSYTSGSIKIGLGNTSYGDYSGELSSAGTHVINITHTNVSAPHDLVVFTWTSGAVMTIDNISVKEVL
jgi:hypothetical protein